MRKGLVWVFTAVVLVGGVSAQDEPIIISLPIHGQFALSGNLPGTIVRNGDNQLLVIDTFNGEIDVLMEREKSIYSPVWRSDGNVLAVTNYHPDPAIGIYDIESQSYADILITPGKSPYSKSWSPDGSQILGYSYGRSDGAAQYQIQILNVNNSAVTTLFSYTDNNPVTDVPLPSGVSNFELWGSPELAWNPVYPEWILVHYDGYDDALIDVISGYPSIFSLVFLYNLQTDEKLSIDALFGQLIHVFTVGWSPDGRSILLGAFQDCCNAAFIRFENLDGTGKLQVIDQLETIDVSVSDWLGVSDLLLTSASDDTDDWVFNVAQFIDGTWHTTEFLRIPDATFERKRDLDWHLNASEEEKRALTCLFDQAMPSRLSVGIHARVNFTNGTPLRLRDAPDFDAIEITQMAEGTAFDVIGGPACINGDSYYRFWQVELADGTIGWAAEADSDEYFMEPTEGR